MKRKRAAQKKIVRLDSLEQINLHAAGLDIGAEEIYACVPEDSAPENVRCFGTYTAALHELARWLQDCAVDTVALESTGVYWIPIYEVLAEYGFALYLVNARHVKNVSGRKSDILDCQWLQQLHTYGLLRGSFRPSEEICTVRALVRQRDMLIRQRAAHIQHMQKALEQMNVKLTEVVADITGVTGMHIIRAILRGERDPLTLAQYRQPGCRHSRVEIAQALEGHYRREHVFTLQQAVALYDTYSQHIQACDAELDALYAQFEPPIDLVEHPLPPATKRQRPGKGNRPTFDLRQALYQVAGTDLTQIDGVNVLVAQTVITEVGVDMSQWATVKHFTSWLGLCPNNQITGGKVKRRGRRKTKNRAALVLRMAAQSLSRSQSALGAYYRRMRAKHGAEKANICAAHKLARIIYFMLKNHSQYQDMGPEAYDERFRQRRIRNLQRQARQLGFRLQPDGPNAVVS